MDKFSEQEIFNNIESQIRESLSLKNEILSDRELIKDIYKVSLIFVDSLLKQKKILFAGNGGSAADAQHMAAELVGRFGFDRPALNAIALTTDSSILTAVGNDYGFESIFSRQIDALGKNDDVFFAISTSGNSQNIIKAITHAKAKKMVVIGLTGKEISQMDMLCDFIIKVPSSNTARIQEVHLLIEHIICNLVEKMMFSEMQSLKK